MKLSIALVAIVVGGGVEGFLQTHHARNQFSLGLKGYTSPVQTDSMADLYGSAPPKPDSMAAFKAKKPFTDSPASVTTLYGPPQSQGAQAVQEVPPPEPMTPAASAPPEEESVAAPNLIQRFFPKPAPKRFTGERTSLLPSLCTPPRTIRRAAKLSPQDEEERKRIAAITSISRRPFAPPGTKAPQAGPIEKITDLYESRPPKATGSAPKAFTKKVYKSVTDSTTSGLYGPP